LSQKKLRLRNPAHLASAISLICGIGLVFGELYLRKIVLKTISSELDIVLYLIELIGLTIFTGGVLGFALQLMDWTNISK